MDAIEFFDLILPARGLRCMAIPATKGFRHYFGPDNAWLASAVAVADSHGANVYHACSSFRSRSSREQSNVEAVRSFWVDIDAGPDKPYPTARAAAEGVLSFALKLGLARPFLVLSGRGVHAYWPMSVDMEPAVWKLTAQTLKAALTAEGVGQDPSRTADEASVLRPPGSTHRKAEPRPVKVALKGTVSLLEDFQAALMPYLHLVPQHTAPDNTFLPEGAQPGGLEFASNADLSAGVERRVPDADRIADRCAIMGMFREKGGAIDQPTWYAGLGILCRTQDGDAKCHEWSKGDPRYSPAETTAKIAQQMKLTGATSCGKLGEQHPTICAACPHNGTIKTPWVLGLDPGETVVVEQRVQDPVTGTWSLKKVLTDAPEGFRYQDVKGRRGMSAAFLNKEVEKGVEPFWDWKPFCETRVIPITRLWMEGVAWVECEMEVQDDKRRFLLEGSLIGKGKDTLAGELARNEIVCLPGTARHMDSYLQTWMTRLKETADQVQAHRHFGWEGRSFVMGQDVMHPGGDATRTVLVGMAKSKAEALVPQGTLEAWVDIIDRAYNAPGQEGFQFLVAASFAAPLLSMMKQVSGVTVYAHSEGSGVGKTTAQKAGLSAWGNWDQLMLADKKVTPNAMWGLMGAYHSLPIVFDELTNMPNEIASDLVFSVSSGRSKDRMTAGGELRENNSNWCTIMLASGNNLLSEKLSLHRGNAEAEISRLFEYTLTAAPHLSPNEANGLFPRLMLNYGHAGQKYARYLVDHYDEVESMLLQTQAKLNESLGITQVERYWSALISATLVSLALCRNLGLLHFDMRALKAWMIARLAENRVQRDEATNEPLELFGMMMSDMWEGVLVTHGEGDMRKGVVATVAKAPRGEMFGRAIIPLDNSEVPVLMLNAQTVRDWSNTKGVSAREMFNAAVAAGWADADMVRYALGRGTLEYSQTSSYLRCWKLYPRRVAEGVADQSVAQKLGVIDGGLAGTGS